MSQSGNCPVNVIKGFRAAGARLPSTNVALVWFIGLTLLCREALNRPTFLRDWLTRLACLYVMESRNSRAPQNNSNDLQCGTLTNELSTWADFFCEKIVADKNNSVNNSVDVFGKNHRDIQLGRHFVAHYDYIEKFNLPTATFREPLNEDQMKARLFAVYVYMSLNRRQRNESEAISFHPKFLRFTRDTHYVHRSPHEIRNALEERNKYYSLGNLSIKMWLHKKRGWCSYHFDIFCDQILNRCLATWHLPVLYLSNR